MAYEFDLSAVEAARKLAVERGESFADATRGESLVDRATKEAASLASMTKRAMGATTVADEYLRSATGGFGLDRPGHTGSFIDQAMRDAANGRQKFIDTAMGKTGSIADAVGNLASVRRMDEHLLAGIKGQIGRYDTATSLLEQELERAKRHDPLGFRETELFNPPEPMRLPPMPRNPILKTNELLDEVIEGLDEQRGLIEASAEAQRQETELLGRLVEAFTASQIASDEAAKRSQMLAWIGIGVAIVTSVVTIVLQAMKII